MTANLASAQGVDAAIVLLYAFYAFFFGLIIFLRREDKREGYPTISARTGLPAIEGFPALPSPKVFLLADGRRVQAPRTEALEEVRPPEASSRLSNSLDAPLLSGSEAMLSQMGAAAFAKRDNHPHLCSDDLRPAIVPLRAAPEFHLAMEDISPVGFTVYGHDGNKVGSIVDVWVDRSEYIVRYLEVELNSGGKRLIPMPLVSIHNGRGQVTVRTLLASQFQDIFELSEQDQITAREEDQISAYFAGGQLYSVPNRLGPIL